MTLPSEARFLPVLVRNPAPDIAMTTPSLYKPRARLRPPTLSAPPIEPRAREEVRAAAIQDLLEPFLFDDALLVEAACDELRDPVSRPRIVEFGCGIGGLTIPVLATRPDAVYHGFDDSEARIAVVTTKLSRRGHQRGATFTAPIALDRRAIGDALQGLRADFLLLPRFLQTVPLCVAEGRGLHRVAFLALCQQLVKPGGRILIIEDVFGESADEHAQLSAALRDGFRARLVAELERVVTVLRGLDPDLARRVARLPGAPSLLGELRDRIQPPGVAQVLPLTAWQRMFEHLGFTYRTVQHPTQKQLFLFTVRC